MAENNEINEIQVGGQLDQKASLKKVLELLEQAGGRLNSEDDITFSGTQYVLPEGSSLKKAAEFIIEKIELDEQPTTFSRTFKFRPWDGAQATMKAMKKVFGMVSQKPMMSFFGPIPPELRTINVGVYETMQVPWGNLAVPGLDGVTFTVGGTKDRELGVLFHISASGPRKHRAAVEGLFNVIQETLENDSIYRGKAFNGQEEPDFLDLSGVDPSKVVYSQDTLNDLNTHVWANIRFPEQMSENGVSLKRAVLFEGPYGTGKTLGAYLTAQISVNNGWTFIYCRPGRDSLEDVMQTARLYQPCVVFFEDVDVIGQADGETGTISKVLDIFDGVNAKGTKIMCVFTTNHVEQLHKGLMRPGRFDGIIHIGELDEKGIEKMARSLIPEHLLANDIDWAEVAEAMKGYLPAFVKEATERSLRYSIARNNGVPGVLVTEDLVASAKGLRRQYELMQDASDETADRSVGLALEKLVREAVEGFKVIDPYGEQSGTLAVPELTTGL